MKKFTLLAITGFIAVTTFSQVRITIVDPVAQNVTIKNMGSTAADISSYWFCSLFNYSNIGMTPVTVLVGDLMLDPGEMVSLNWFTSGMAVSGSDLALYEVNNFPNPSDMRDFVQWETSGNGREPEANTAGLWAAGTFIAGSGPYYFTGGAADIGVNFWSTDPPQPPPPSGPCSELFFSEYIEGSSNNKALEIYNPTSDAVDLVNYEVHRFNNGATTNPSVSGFDPGTMLNSGSVYVFGNGSAVVDITSVADTLSSVTFFNGDDALVLLNVSTADTLDVFGNLGEDPGSNWPVDTGATSEFTLVRKSTIQEGSTNWAVGATEWDVYAQNEFSYLGSHVMEPCGPPEPEPCAELFFSEYIEGSSSNKAMEVYNPTELDVDLTDYVIYRANNGSLTPTDSLFPQGILAAGEVFIFGNPSADPIILAETDTTHTLTFYNGDDAVWIQNITTGDTLDIIGLIGEDPGSGWTVGTGATNNFTLVRKSSVQKGSLDWNVGATEWDVYAIDDFSFLGSHVMEPCGPPEPESCTELFFSEYIEGSSSNKAMEVYNPTELEVDLTDYVIYRANNGSLTPTDSLFPQGILAAGEVFIFGNPSADPIILAETDTTHTLTFYNGDDAVWIQNITTGDTLDIIGLIGEDPGSGWTVGTGATNNFTLVRKSSVQKGSLDWNIGATEWDVYAIDDFSFLGSHAMIPCGFTAPIVGFPSASATIDESAGTYDVQISLSNNNGQPIDVTLDVIGGTATDGEDYSGTFPIVISFQGTLDETLVEIMTIIDDLMIEPNETIEFQLSMPTNGAELGTDLLTVTITDNDQPIPLYDIGEINTVDAAGVSDSLDVECEIRGLVYGVNTFSGGVQFTLIDETGGIGTFDSNEDFGYTVLEGDSVACIGMIGQFNGLTQMYLDTIILLSQFASPINDPTVITSLGEDTESQLVMMECVYIIDLLEWTNSGSGFNVEVTNGTDTIEMRIDNDVDIFGTTPPTGIFNLVGIGGQFTFGPPYLDGYQLLPRYMADISDDTGCTQPPANNDCFGSTDIDDLFHQGFDQVQESGIFNNDAATVTGTDPPFGWECFGEPSIENTTWYTFVGDGETYSISTSDCNGTVTDYIDDGDTQMAIYSGDCNNLVGDACNEDSPLASAGNWFAGLDFETTAGVNYYVLIDGYETGGGVLSNGEFCIQVNQLTTGLDELDDLGINIYPNPVNDVLKIQSNGLLVDRVEVYNAVGALMYEESLNALNANINTAAWVSGAYVVRILAGGKLLQQSIIKQ